MTDNMDADQRRLTDVSQEDREVVNRLLEIASQNGGVCSRKRLNTEIQNIFKCDSISARSRITRIDLIPYHLQAQTFGASWTSAGKSFQIVGASDSVEPDETGGREGRSEVDCAPESEDDSETGTSRIKTKKSNKAIEDAMCEDIRSTLEDFYPESPKEHWQTKEKFPTCFNVGAIHKGSTFENIDVLAIHWKNDHHYEIVAVEAKQDFTAEAVYQALSYSRFAHRVWVAVLIPPKTSGYSHIEWLMEKNLELFEYAVDMGLGILACRRTQGGGNGRYNVSIQSYPRLQTPNKVSRENFESRYREQLVRAGVLNPHQ